MYKHGSCYFGKMGGHDLFFNVGPLFTSVTKAPDMRIYQNEDNM
jgi:hypothetical protein